LRELLEFERLRVLNDGASTSEYATRLGTEFRSAYLRDAGPDAGLR